MYVQCRYAVQIPKNSRYVNILSQNEKKRRWTEFDSWTHLQSKKENISPLNFNKKHLTIVALVSQKKKKITKSLHTWENTKAIRCSDWELLQWLMGNSEYGLEVGAAEPEDFFPERFVLPEAQQSETNVYLHTRIRQLLLQHIKALTCFNTDYHLLFATCKGRHTYIKI